MTDNEIVKALRSWLEEIRKSRQAYLEKVNEEHYPSMRYEYLLSDTIHEINRQKEEIERLTSGKSIYLSDDETTEYCVEGPCPNYKTEAQIKTEAYKEFVDKAIDRVEKAKEKYQRLCKEQGEEMEEHMYIHFNGIINILKELVGEDK